MILIVLYRPQRLVFLTHKWNCHSFHTYSFELRHLQYSSRIWLLFQGYLLRSLVNLMYMKRFWLMTRTFRPIIDGWQKWPVLYSNGRHFICGSTVYSKKRAEKKVWQFGSTDVDQNFRNHQPYHKLCQTQFTTSEAFSKPWKWVILPTVYNWPTCCGH